MLQGGVRTLTNMAAQKALSNNLCMLPSLSSPLLPLSLTPHLPPSSLLNSWGVKAKQGEEEEEDGGREGGREEDGVLGGLWVTGQGLVPTSITTPFGNGHTNASMNQKLQFSCQLVDFKAQLQTSTSDFNHFTQKLRFFQCQPKLWVVARGLKFLGFQFLFIIILFHS